MAKISLLTKRSHLLALLLAGVVMSLALGVPAAMKASAALTTATRTIPVTLPRKHSAPPELAAVFVAPTPGSVVISQVYGGGGNSGAQYKNDFIELFNRSADPVDLTGCSVQYASSTGTSWQVTALPAVILQPGQYFLVQEAAGTGTVPSLPTPDATGTIAMAAGAGKVALASSATALSGTCPTGTPIIDFVGFGAANCFEGTAGTPTLTNTTAALRASGGCLDTNNNNTDFATGAPTPRNTATTVNNCSILSATAAANPSTVNAGDTSTLSVVVVPAPTPPSTGITVVANLTAIGGSTTQAFSGTGNTYSFVANIPVNTTGGVKAIPVTVSDAEGRTFNLNIALSVQSLAPVNHLVISQVYGGGGNTGATFTNDYVELYNPTAAPVTITGWSLQYSSATGTTWTNKQPLGGIIGAGEYYLVSLASGGAIGAPLPINPNIAGDINISGTAGKLALVSNIDSLTGACPFGIDPDLVDFVGYGTTANCREGSATAPAPSNTTAIFRKSNGLTDTDQNNTDFVTGAPAPRRTAPIVELGPWVAGTEPITNGNNVPYDATITVDFSEPVTVEDGWFSLVSTVTGQHISSTVVSYNDGKGFHITPNDSFQFGEQCTVTIIKEKVHDQDLDDSAPDTDTLFANYSWSFNVVSAGQPAPYDPTIHLALGNPSDATTSLADANNYLMVKPTYALSYNRDKGTPNWVSWHLDQSWFGSLARVDTFRADPRLPANWYRVQSTDYFASGFDRGHMTPNADRDNENRIPINQETYLMTNMIPQSPDNNQGPWAAFENELRTILATNGEQEAYVISGPAGVGGSGSNGGTTNTIANGNITVPAYTWKVVLVLPKGEDDLARATCAARTIAILMPNVQGIRNNSWQNYLTTVDAIEALTGYNFFSNLPEAVQNCLEAGTNGINPPGTANQIATTTEDNAVEITLHAVRSNANSISFSVDGAGPTNGTLSAISPATCTDTVCTATATYTPGQDYNGQDSFNFKVNDGSVNSNVATVNLNISAVNDAVTIGNDAASTAEDTSLNLVAADLTQNDSAGPANENTQSLTVSSVTATADTHGTITLVNGTITYLPETNYNGAASFMYEVCDDGKTNGVSAPSCASGTVNLNVVAVNDVPVAGLDVKSINQDNTLIFPASDLLANDAAGPANESTQTLTITGVSVTANTQGTVALSNGNVIYTPTPFYSGPASFTYQVCDNGTTNGGADFKCAVGTVNVTVVFVPDMVPPTIACSSDIVVDFNPAVNGAVVTYTAPVGTDNRPGATTTQIAGLASGATFPLGTTTNTFRVTDAAGNSTQCSFKVTIVLTAIIGLNGITIDNASYLDSYDSTGSYPATKSSLANLLSNGTISLANSGKVWGAVRSTRAGVQMAGASSITGNATAGTTVTRTGSATVGGVIMNNALVPATTLPVMPTWGSYSSNTGISGNYSYNQTTGDLTVGSANIVTLANGVYTFHNLTLTNSAQLRVNGSVVIKLTGTLNAGGETRLNNTPGNPANLQIVSSNTSANGVIISNGANAYLVLYAPQTTVNIGGASLVFGTVVGKTIVINNGGTLHYDTRVKSVWPALWTILATP